MNQQLELTMQLEDLSISEKSTAKKLNHNIFMYSSSTLSTEEIYAYLVQKCDDDSVHTNRIQNPKGGEVYLYYNPEGPHDYLCDGFKWNNQSKKLLPLLNPLIEVTYYKAKSSIAIPDCAKKFKKRVCRLIDSPKLIYLIQYEGDEEHFPPGAHGNVKNPGVNTHEYERTKPSVMESLKQELQNKNPSEVYKNAKQNSKPRNVKLCRNIKYLLNQESNIGLGSIENLYVLHLQFKFPSRIVLAPELEVIAVDEILLKEVIKLLKVLKSENKKMCIQYDTTFNLTNYYVSILTFVHPFLLNNRARSPPIPLFYYFHTRKFEETHEEFWRFVAKSLGKLVDSIFVITDCEDGIRTAIRIALKEYNVPLLRCWKHLDASIEAWLNKRKVGADIPYYTSSVRELLLQDSQSDFELDLLEKKKVWKPEFTEYFEKHIMPDIPNLAKYSILDFCADHFNFYSGVTTNSAEGLNNLFHIVMNHKRRPVDILCLAMYQLSIYYSNEILLGFANKGEYRLKPEYIDSKIDAKYIITREVKEPTEIIKELIENPEAFLKLAGISSETASESNSQASSRSVSESTSVSSFESVVSSRTTSESTDFTDNESKTISKTTTASTIMALDEQNTDKENEADDVFDVGTTETVKPLFKLPNYYNAKIARAIWFNSNKRISFSEEYKVYHVKDESDNVFMVQLMPVAKCSCVEKSNCCHILGVRHYNGENLQYNDNQKLSELIATKQSGSKFKTQSGSKRKYHFRNTHNTDKVNEVQSVSANSNSAGAVLTYLIELISEGNCVIDYIDSKKKFTEDMVLVDSSKLTDIFINPSFTLSSLNEYFDEDAWKLVLDVVNSKIKTFTCPKCSELCLNNDRLQCTLCLLYYHGSCSNASKYMLTKGKTWKCSFCLKKI